MKKLLKKSIIFIGLFVINFALAQTAATVDITFSQMEYETTEDISFTLTFDGGDDGAGTDFNFVNARAVVATRNIVRPPGGFADFQSFTLPNTINGVHAGTDVAFTRPAVGAGALTSAELAALPTPKEHVMYIEYETDNQGNTFGTSIPFTVVAPAVIQDSWSFVGSTYTQDSSLEIAIRYTSEDDIAMGGISFALRSDTQPFSSVEVATYSNTSILTAGTNESATITIDNFPAAYTIEGTDGGTIFDNAGLLAANPNGQMNATNAFFLLRPAAGSDMNFTPTLPGDNFLTIEADLTLSIQDLQQIGINAFYNNRTQSIDLSSANTIEKVNVYSLSGQVVSSREVNNANTMSIDVSNLSSGVYIARISNASGEATMKFAF